MDSTKYTTDYETHGLAKIESIIPAALVRRAHEYEELFKSLTLEGNVTRENRSVEQKNIDKQATKELLAFRAEDVESVEIEARAWGFMLYNEASITKIYWTKRVGKLRQDKREFFALDKYLEWLTEIYAVLSRGHSKYTDPLYYFKLSTRSRSGNIVGDYDVMNSFRVHWNMYFLPILAMYLYQEDQKESDYGISIDAALENENGAGNHLEAEISAQMNTVCDSEQYVVFSQVENFLKAFLKAPLNEPVPLNATAKGYGVTYLQILKSIVDGSWSSGQAAYEMFKIGPSIQANVLSRIKSEMKEYDIDLKDFAEYLDSYRNTAIDILNGENVSFTTER